MANAGGAGGGLSPSVLAAIDRFARIAGMGPPVFSASVLGFAYYTYVVTLLGL